MFSVKISLEERRPQEAGPVSHALTCLSINVVCSDDLLLLLVPGDLHHRVAPSGLVATGQDGLLLRHGEDGIF